MIASSRSSRPDVSFPPGPQGPPLFKVKVLFFSSRPLEFSPRTFSSHSWIVSIPWRCLFYPPLPPPVFFFDLYKIHWLICCIAIQKKVSLLYHHTWLVIPPHRETRSPLLLGTWWRPSTMSMYPLHSSRSSLEKSLDHFFWLSLIFSSLCGLFSPTSKTDIGDLGPLPGPDLRYPLPLPFQRDFLTVLVFVSKRCSPPPSTICNDSLSFSFLIYLWLG